MDFFKCIGIISLIAFSFFLTDFVTEVAIYNNGLMKSIKTYGNNYVVESVNATVIDNTIIPGISGKAIDEVESYFNMKDFGEFNKNYLIYKTVLPDISIEDNKDKVIISGNKSKRQVSILIGNNKDCINYSNRNLINFTKLIKINESISNKDNINIESDKEKFKDLNTLLKHNKSNNNICLINYSNIEECINNDFYLVKFNKEINNSNIKTSINDIENGYIIFISDNLSLVNYKLLLNYISSKDLEIVYLSDLIKE